MMLKTLPLNERQNNEPLLQLVQISKHFGTLVALQDVSLQVSPGEVVGLVGRRGAGKSTLLQLIGGMYPPNNGAMIFGDKAVRLTTPAQAQRLGISLVHQVPLLAENLDVIANILLGQEISKPRVVGLPDDIRMAHRAAEVLAELSADGMVNAKISNLSDEQRQIVALARSLCAPARLLLLDDALAVLSYDRQARMLERIRQLAQAGVAVIIASDNLKHLFAITQRIVVLYEGRIIADRLTGDSTPREIVEWIVGSTRQEQVTPIIWALESYHQVQQQTEELHRTQATLRQSLEQQDTLNRQLLERLRKQVDVLDQLNVALQAAQLRLMTEREEERKFLARELHDQVIQDLLSFNYRLEDIESEVDDEDQQQELAAIRQSVRSVVTELRQLCSDLRPPTIDAHGLKAAIRSLAEEWAERNRVQLDLSIDPKLGRLPEALELSVFRIVQEGLNNIRKHAEAQHVSLRVERTPTASILVRLADDGQGLAKPIDLAELSAAKHFGLVGISERVALLGGTMQIESPYVGGTLLQVEIPSPSPIV
ncbi:MAG TPA: ATP-binding cassette domain-containing protein [Anaerolineae bacterium]|nr:ATP-binding cassette domain-containing protein [Anaerolineae bacterium]